MPLLPCTFMLIWETLLSFINTICPEPVISIIKNASNYIYLPYKCISCCVTDAVSEPKLKRSLFVKSQPNKPVIHRQVIHNQVIHMDHVDIQKLNNFTNKLDISNINGTTLGEKINEIWTRNFANLETTHDIKNKEHHTAFYVQFDKWVDIIFQDHMNCVDYFRIAKNKMGRTALCIDGYDAEIFVHLGVVNIFIQKQLLPQVISSSGAAAIIAGILATKDDTELNENTFEFLTTELWSSVLCKKYNASLSTQDGYLYNDLMKDHLSEIIKHHVGHYTFVEAYKKSSRNVSITISYIGNEHNEIESITLNRKNSFKNVPIHKAVLAACLGLSSCRPEFEAEEKGGKKEKENFRTNYMFHSKIISPEKEEEEEKYKPLSKQFCFDYLPETKLFEITTTVGDNLLDHNWFDYIKMFKTLGEQATENHLLHIEAILRRERKK
eukprot:524351_1